MSKDPKEARQTKGLNRLVWLVYCV